MDWKRYQVHASPVTVWSRRIVGMLPVHSFISLMLWIRYRMRLWTPFTIGLTVLSDLSVLYTTCSRIYDNYRLLILFGCISRKAARLRPEVTTLFTFFAVRGLGSFSPYWRLFYFRTGQKHKPSIVSCGRLLNNSYWDSKVIFRPIAVNGPHIKKSVRESRRLLSRSHTCKYQLTDDIRSRISCALIMLILCYGYLDFRSKLAHNDKIYGVISIV